MVDQLMEQIRARLESLGIFKDVLTAADLADLEERQQQTPGVSVIYQGIVIDDTAHSSKAAKIRDRVGIVITETFTQYDAANLYAKAAPLTEQTIGRLIGWTPEGYMHPLTLAGAPEPLFTEEGFAYFPLEFDIKRTIRADS